MLQKEERESKIMWEENKSNGRQSPIKLFNNGDGDGDGHVNPFKFFKIIFPATLQSKILRVPEAFVKECKPRFPGTATLRTPRGLTWKVVLRKLEGMVYFTGQGWVDFMDHNNNIRENYFLEFEYLGNNLFNVCIFDYPSADEIDYPTKSRKHKTCMDDDDNNNDEGDDDDEEEIHDAEDTIRKSNRPYFSVTVKKYNISVNAYLHIPRGFGNKYMKGKVYKFAELQVSDGREWVVKCHYINGSIRLNGAGWRKFYQGNHWSKGHIYTFTLLNCKPNILVFKVFKKHK